MKKRKQTLNRVRLLRGVSSILKNDSEHLLNAVALRKKLFSDLSPPTKSQSVDLSNSLRSWAIDYRIQKRALTTLLKILIAFGLTSLPKDSRTLLKTPRFIPIENVADGQYWYNGIENCLKNIFGKLTSNITLKLNFNFDGLPLFKSSPISFWPILANIHGWC